MALKKAGTRRYSAYLVQGGKDVPCKYILTGEKSIKKAHFWLNTEQRLASSAYQKKNDFFLFFSCRY